MSKTGNLPRPPRMQAGTHARAHTLCAKWVKGLLPPTVGFGSPRAAETHVRNATQHGTVAHCVQHATLWVCINIPLWRFGGQRDARHTIRGALCGDAGRVRQGEFVGCMSTQLMRSAEYTTEAAPSALGHSVACASSHLCPRGSLCGPTGSVGRVGRRCGMWSQCTSRSARCIL